MSNTYETPPHGWTCFHCGETFTTVGGAADHFGAKPDAVPGCMLRVSVGGERGLLMALRKVECELAELYRQRADEDGPLHREIARLQSRHSDGLHTAEEAGYARGLRDAARKEEPKFTTGHCAEKAKPGGCQLHNLHCGYPACDRRAMP